MGRYTSGGIGRDIVAGAVAGMAAVWLIDKMQLTLTHPAAADQPTDMDPAHAAAAMAADKLGADIGDRRDNAVGHTVHYGVGAGMGALYGLLRGMAPAVSTGRGALYGLGAFLLADEIGAPALGLARSPLHYPARAHASGALAHAVFGVSTDLGTRLMAPWRDEVVIYHGPSFGERIETGRQALEDGRDYVYEQGGRYLDQGRDVLDRGRAYASDWADQARSRADEVDVSDLADRGKRGVRRFVDRVRDFLPDADDVADFVDRGRRQVRDVAADVSSRLPDRDDVADLAKAGQRRGRRFVRDVQSQLPDRDDAVDVAERGRKSVRRLAEQARDQVPGRDSLPGGRFIRWLFG